VELFEEYANESANYLDKVICGNFESINLTSLEGTFDYVIFSDSLEHFYDSKSALNKAKLLINPSGSILISIPNIRNFRVLAPLLLLGRFEYEDEGLLDRTHIRFFTRSSITKLLQDCGLDITSIQYDLPVTSKTGILNLLTLGFFRDILTSHYFISSCKRNL
jgi:2-polyprenyl-3-methyl-5-hydroxy-6-metoxy-1,4-benzoquinol methylase